MKKPVDVLVTSALVYANGPLHLGHLVESIQADIWVRVQKMQGKNCLFLSGDDAHGSAIMLNAKKCDTDPETFIQDMYAQHVADTKDFYIDFDHYHTTHSEENRTLSQEVFQCLQHDALIVEKEISQAYDAKENIFLPDRFVKGTCPKCQAPDQYGDNCEACGAVYTPIDLLDPISTLSQTAPITRKSVHLFFTLEKRQQQLSEWLAHTPLQPEVKNKLSEWFKDSLHDWDISRDAPYFGFEIPGYPDKYFYVWLDAPIGYLACLQDYCNQNPDYSLPDIWGKDSPTQIIHFIGKDILYFHGLFWPAMLMSSPFALPSHIHAHGFLTINHQKMSKSRGTYITARRYLDVLPAEYLRYYFACKLHAGIHDIDLNWQDFQQTINSDLIGKVINIASRSASFIHKHFAGKLGDTLDEDIIEALRAPHDTILDHYQNKRYHLAIQAIMLLADQANQYIDQQAPWKQIKDPDQQARVQCVCATALNCFRLLIIYLSPVLPRTAQSAATFLNEPQYPYQWKDLHTPLQNQTIQAYPRLMERVDPAQLKTLQADMQHDSTT